LNYILDTNVVSAFGPGGPNRPAPNAGLSDWITVNSERLFLSAITPLEIEIGILKMARKSPGKLLVSLQGWYANLREQFAERIIPLDLQVARVAASIADRNAAVGYNPGLADITIAATAGAHDMTVLTRNIKHFSVSGVPAIDPFVHLPGNS
jgi:predicted nucleic acid-binding protein